MSLTTRPSLLYLSMYDPHLPLSGAETRGYQFVSELARVFDLDLIDRQDAERLAEVYNWTRNVGTRIQRLLGGR